MSNSDTNERLISIREEIAGLSDEQITSIGNLTAALTVAGYDDLSESIIKTLDNYENEIIRLQSVNARLRNKNRNYRTGMKALQRAHESTLHKVAVAQSGYAQLKELVEQGGACQVGNDGPYTPIRFNNEQPLEVGDYR